MPLDQTPEDNSRKSGAGSDRCGAGKRLTPLERRNAVAADYHAIKQVLMRTVAYEPYSHPVGVERSDKEKWPRHLTSHEKAVADDELIDLFGMIVSVMDAETKKDRRATSTAPASDQEAVEVDELMPICRSMIVEVLAKAELDNHNALEKCKTDIDRQKLLVNGKNRWRSVLSNAKATGMIDSLIYYGALKPFPAIAGAHQKLVLTNLGRRIASFLLGRADNPDPNLLSHTE